MSDMEAWQQDNTRYLSASLEWLRLRLTKLAGSAPTSPAEHLASAEPKSSFVDRVLGRHTELPALSPAVLLPARTESFDDTQAAEAITAIESQMESPPALVVLSQRLGLSRFEREVLFLCAAMELDTRIAALCARAQDDANRPYPTFALALTLFDEPAWDALSPERPLRYWRLLEIHQPPDKPLTQCALRADECIVNYLKGLNYLDDRLTPLLVPVDVPTNQPPDLPPSQRGVVDAIGQQWRHTLDRSPLPVIQLLGADAASKQLIAGHAAAALGRHLYRMPAELLPAQAAELETFARLWQRESILLPVALYLDAQEVDGESAVDGHVPPLSRFLARADGVFFLGVRESWSRLGRANFAVDVAKPTLAEQQAAWAAALGDSAGENPGRLAAQFSLNPDSIRQIAQSALADANGDANALSEHLWDACRASARPRLDALAQRLEPKATWEDIVIPAEQSNLLHQIAGQVGQRSKVYEEWGFARKMNRGLGISALFAGESGTGKTMAAEVIANDLRLNLYRIDLSAVVSKYIGETEKNLRRLFDAAEDGAAILFFDEADALFGKRSEVKDSHDRYANIEINYLLQRMEAYRGLAILATNMKNALDPAFMRRLRFIVNFPFPDAADRKRMWQKVFPAGVPLDRLDYDRLARLNLAGGGIHSVAINAAFLAAPSNAPLTMPVILQAARSEFLKMDKPINEVDFR